MNHLDFKPFYSEALQAKQKFIDFVNSQDWNTNLRTEAETLIIYYDQLLERYENALDRGKVRDDCK